MTVKKFLQDSNTLPVPAYLEGMKAQVDSLDDQMKDAVSMFDELSLRTYCPPPAAMTWFITGYIYGILNPLPGDGKIPDESRGSPTVDQPEPVASGELKTSRRRN